MYTRTSSMAPTSRCAASFTNVSVTTRRGSSSLWCSRSRRFDDFVTRYNTDRPHQALDMKVPADVYVRSARVYRGLEELTYPLHDQTILVTGCGRICFRGRKVNLSHVFAGSASA